MHEKIEQWFAEDQDIVKAYRNDPYWRYLIKMLIWNVEIFEKGLSKNITDDVVNLLVESYKEDFKKQQKLIKLIITTYGYNNE